MVRKIFLLLAITFPFLFTGCRFGKPVAPTQSVYATAYAILTQTAEYEGRLPTQNNATVPAAPTEKPVSSELTPSNTPVILGQTGQVTATPAAPGAFLTQMPVNPGQVQATATPNSSAGGSPGVAFLTPTSTSLSVNPSSTPVIPAPLQGLVGVWQQKITGWVLNFNQDGSYELAESFGNLKSERIDEGAYTLQNDQVTLNGSGSSVNCRNLTGNYRYLASLANERIFTLIADACYERQRALPWDAWYWLPVKPDATPSSPDAEEVPVEGIPLGGVLSGPQARISGMDWYGDKLLFLPQDPRFNGAGSASIYWIGLETIIDYLNDYIPGPLTPLSIPLNDSAVMAQVSGFQGYQAISVHGNQVYLLIQADAGSGPRTYLVSGSISADENLITLDASRLIELPVQSGSSIRTYRSILKTDSEVLVLPDIAGSGLNNSPTAVRFDNNLNLLGTLPMSSINYMVTDATSLIGGDRFWVINKYAPGDPGGITGIDPLAQLYGTGVTHDAFDYIERLIGYQYSASGITLSAEPPIQMELSAYGPRDWQGAVTLGNQGVLVITNQNPGTILGYVSYP